jgi:hypothetical protein
LISSRIARRIRSRLKALPARHSTPDCGPSRLVAPKSSNYCDHVGDPARNF